MKRKTAKDILAESFRELAEKKKVDKITVRDIAENCGYSTTTFYRHFKDKYDLIAWDHTRYVSQIMDRVGKDGYSWNQTLYEGMVYYEMQGCIPLSQAELQQLKALLDKALTDMKVKG